MLATIVANLWELRATTAGVAYLDDSSVQEEMVRSATALMRAGHLPLDAWYPYLGLGSPQFLHYQSAPAMLTGLAGIVVGPNVAYRWSLYLLWSCWPLVVFLSARVFRMRPWAAASAAAVAPLLASVPGIGYEAKAYLWIGYGVWAQLWASWFLPFAWAFTWRAMEDRRFMAPAAVAIAITASLHFETGYLALMPIVLFPFLVPSDLRQRIVRAVGVGAGALLAGAWAILPLVLLGKWASINEALQGTGLVNGYGARQIMSWLVDGQLLDDGHFPVVTALAAAGIVAVILCWRKDKAVRPILVVAWLGVVLAFGRTTFGPVTNILPGGRDLFFRRFEMAAMLGAIYLAGIGAAAIASLARRLLDMARRRVPALRGGRVAIVPVVLVCLAGLACLFPAWKAAASYDGADARDIAQQQTFESIVDPQIAPLVAYIEAHGGGRVYAGMPSNWGKSFQVGYVPVYEYLASQDLDEIGFTLRTAALMTGPEYDFDEQDPSDYALFGIRYLLLPAGRSLPVTRRLVLSSGPYRLYVIPGNGYFRVVDTVGSVSENRSDVARQSYRFLIGDGPGEGRYLTVAFAGAKAPAPTLPAPAVASGPPGAVTSTDVDLTAGMAEATVHLTRRAVVALSASYDVGWTATLDGKPVTPEMLAPALVGVEVPAGTHKVTLRYDGFAWYPELFALVALTVVVLVLFTTPAGGALRRRARRRGGALASDT